MYMNVGVISFVLCISLKYRKMTIFPNLSINFCNISNSWQLCYPYPVSFVGLYLIIRVVCKSFTISSINVSVIRYTEFYFEQKCEMALIDSSLFFIFKIDVGSIFNYS